MRIPWSWFVRLGLLLTVAWLGIGCPEPTCGCAKDTDCSSPRVCEVNTITQCGVCTASGGGAGGGAGGGGGSATLCTSGGMQAGQRTELLNGPTGLVASFDFTQTRFLEPAPCTSNLDMSLRV